MIDRFGLVRWTHRDLQTSFVPWRAIHLPRNGRSIRQDLQFKVKEQTLHTLSESQLVTIVDSLFGIWLQPFIVDKRTTLGILIPECEAIRKLVDELTLLWAWFLPQSSSAKWPHVSQQLTRDRCWPSGYHFVRSKSLGEREGFYDYQTSNRMCWLGLG